MENKSLNLPNRIICLFVILFSIVLVYPAFGDIITLVNGNDIFGEITFEGEKSIKIKTPAGNLEFPRERVTKITKETPAVMYGKFGKFYMDRKDYARAVEYYTKALKEDPNNKDFADRLEIVKKSAQTTRSSEAEIAMSAGDRFLAQEQYLDAIDAYARITTLNVDDSWIKRGNEKIAHVYILQANKALEPGNREELVGKALRLDPNSAEAHYEQGLIFLQKSQNELARREFEKSISLDPSFPQTHRILGSMYYAEKNYAKAVEEFEQLRKLSPDIFSGYRQNLTGAYYALGKQAYDAKKYDQAKLYLDKYLELDATGNWTLLYQTEYQLKKLNMDPTSADAHFTLALWLQDKNLNEEALQEYKEAYRIDNNYYKAKKKIIELYDKFSLSLYQAGTMALQNRQYEQAYSNFSRITASYPESSFSAEARRLMSVSREQWADSIYALAKANFDANYFERAYDGFNFIIEKFPDTQKFVDAQRMLARTKSKIRSDETSGGGGTRKQQLDDLQKVIDGLSGEDRQAWTRIRELETMSQYDFEARLSNLTPRERTLIRDNLDRVVYMFFDPSRSVDKLRPIAMKYSLPISDISKVKTQQDYVKLLEFALLLQTSIGGDYYEAWQELIPYFNTGRSELEDAKPGLSQDARRLIEERGSEVYRILDLKAR